MTHVFNIWLYLLVWASTYFFFEAQEEACSCVRQINTILTPMPIESNHAVSKMAGAVGGVSIGCILGLAPLLFMQPGFFRESPPESQQKRDEHAVAV
jgi:hypothetical protein